MSQHELHVLVARLAWTLIHFLWQGALIALVLHLVLAGLRQRSPNLRYVVRCAALGLMALAPVVTFVALGEDAPRAVAVPGSAFLSAEEAPTGSWGSWFASGDLLPWVVLLWSLGAAVCSLRLAGGCWQVWRLRRRATGVDLAPRWQRRFERIAHEFGVRARARVVECAAVSVPTVIGWVKPVVFLPARIFTGLSDEQIEALIAHELAHVSRHDYLVNLVQSVLEALLFYHPAVWWISRGIRIEREYCCDDLAVAATHDGLSYAHALTALESWRSKQPQMGVSTLGGSLMQRIQRLVGVEPVTKPGPLRPFHALAALVIAGSMGVSAFGLAALPDPVPGDDCPCSCHENKKKQKKAEVIAQPELRVRSRYEGTWTPEDLTEHIHQHAKKGSDYTIYQRAKDFAAQRDDVHFGGQRDDLVRLKDEIAQLRETIAQVRSDIAGLTGKAHHGELHLEHSDAGNRRREYLNQFFVNKPRKVVDGWTPGGEEGTLRGWSVVEGQPQGYVYIDTELDPEQHIIRVHPRVRYRIVDDEEHEHGGHLEGEADVEFLDLGDGHSPERRKLYINRLQKVNEMLKGLGELEGLDYRVLVPGIEEIHEHLEGLEGLEELKELKDLRLPEAEYLDASTLHDLLGDHLHQAQKAAGEAKGLQEHHLQWLQKVNHDLSEDTHGVLKVGNELIELKELQNLKSLEVFEGLKILQEIDFEDLEHGQVLHAENLPEGIRERLESVIVDLSDTIEGVELGRLHEDCQLAQDLLLDKIHADHDEGATIHEEMAIQELLKNVQVDLTKEKTVELELEVEDIVEQIKVLVEELEIEEIEEEK